MEERALWVRERVRKCHSRFTYTSREKLLYDTRKISQKKLTRSLRIMVRCVYRFFFFSFFLKLSAVFKHVFLLQRLQQYLMWFCHSKNNAFLILIILSFWFHWNQSYSYWYLRERCFSSFAFHYRSQTIKVFTVRKVVLTVYFRE